MKKILLYYNMSDIDSKKNADSNKDNSKKIIEYLVKLGITIGIFCMIILIGSCVLYASKACGAGVLDIIIPSYYILNLTDPSFKPTECDDTNPLPVSPPKLNTQYINGVNIDNKLKFQTLNFDDAYFKDDILLPGLNKRLKEQREKKNGPNITIYELFTNGIKSSVSIFNLKFLNSYFKFLNKTFSDSTIIIFGAAITILILFIIIILSLFITGYYVIYNFSWILTSDPIEDDDDKTININGVAIPYKPWKELSIWTKIKLLVWGGFIGLFIYCCIIPFSFFYGTYNVLKYIILILSVPSKLQDNPYNIITMFTDIFKYKKPLISYILSWVIVSSSFDIFDTAGGTIAIIVFLLIFFKIIKIGLFDDYIPEVDEIPTFVERGVTKDITNCATFYKVPEAAKSQVPETQAEALEANAEALEPQAEVLEAQAEVPEAQAEVPEAKAEVPEAQAEANNAEVKTEAESKV